jgi:hypothetical protein
MELLRWKARFSVLWLTMAIGTAAWVLFSVLTPGAIEDIMAGEWLTVEISEGFMVVHAIMFLIPLIVAILCLTLNRTANRWLNFIVGIIWVLMFIYNIIIAATGGNTILIAGWLMTIAGLVVSALIAWFAWTWPKQEA